MIPADPNNPWGGPTERSISVKSVDLILRLVDAGRGLVSLMKPADPQRYVRLEKLWSHHLKAESMILAELGRRKRMANQQKKAADALEARPLVDEEDDDDDEDDDYYGVAF